MARPVGPPRGPTVAPSGKPGDRDLIAAHRTALQLGAVVAAIDTLKDAEVLEAAMLADTRRVWGAFDHATGGLPRMVKRPA